MMHAVPRLIGLDWGTTAVRAYLLADKGTVIERRSQRWGVMSTPGRDVAAAFEAIVGDWNREHPGLPAIAAGMIGSTEGWIRAPYCPCPAGLAELAAALVAVPMGRAGTLYVIPGVELRGSIPSMMRGEETQIAGALHLFPELRSDAVLVLPGTHSKWAQMRDGRIERFETYITGELYALLADESILGRPARAARAAGSPVDAADAADAFERGVRTARDSGARGVSSLLFLTRALVLADMLAAPVSLDFLSGLVLGEELRSGLSTARARIALIGDPALCRRYARALALFDVADAACLDDTAPAGLWRVACSAGLAPAVSAALS